MQLLQAVLGFDTGLFNVVVNSVKDCALVTNDSDRESATARGGHDVARDTQGCLWAAARRAERAEAAPGTRRPSAVLVWLTRKERGQTEASGLEFAPVGCATQTQWCFRNATVQQEQAAKGELVCHLLLKHLESGKRSTQLSQTSYDSAGKLTITSAEGSTGSTVTATAVSSNPPCQSSHLPQGECCS